MGLLEEETEEAALSTRALEELLVEHGFEPSEVRGGILKGDAAATPSPARTIRGPQMRVAAMPKVAPFQDLTEVGSGAVTPMGSPELDAMRRRMETAEIKIASMAVGAGPSLAEAMEAQTNTLVAATTRPQGSTIRVGPRVAWPKLGDDGAGGREVEEFYDKLE